jgi:predicted Zn-dependent protease
MSAEALEAANLWVSLDPENVEARQLLTALLVKGGEAGSALDHLERILESEGQTANGFMVVAGLLSREQDKRVALDLMKQLVEKRKDNPDAYFALSHLALRLNEYQEATAAVERALELKPNWDAASQQYARVLVVQGKTVAAMDYLNRLIAKQPDSMGHRLFYARLLMEQERLPEAYEQFKIITKHQPENEDSLFALGFIGLQLNQLEDAEKYLLQLKKIGNRGYEVNYYLGRLEELKGDTQAAQQWYGSITQGEHYVNAQIRIIALISQEGNLEKAQALIQDLKSERPAQKLRLDLVEGEILIEHGKYREAMDLYNQALLEVPENSDLLYARSMVAE